MSVIVLVLVLALALAAPAFAAPKKWTTPPGYRSPAQIEREAFKDWRRERRFAQRYNVPRSYYYYYASPYYYSGRFASERFGSRIGPCWTQTPIGAVWNCGK